MYTSEYQQYVCVTESTKSNVNCIHEIRLDVTYIPTRPKFIQSLVCRSEKNVYYLVTGKIKRTYPFEGLFNQNKKGFLLLNYGAMWNKQVLNSMDVFNINFLISALKQDMKVFIRTATMMRF